MAKAMIDHIRTQSDKLHGRWTRDFAGKPRHTRNLAELEKLLEKSAALAKKAKGIPGEKGDALEKVVVERWKLYRAERDAIAEAQYDRPEVAEIHALGLRVERAMATWRRHYAGRDRKTRDVPRLDEVIATLSAALPRFEQLAEHPEVKREQLDNLRGQLEVLRDERKEIDKARRAEAGERTTFVLAEAQSALDQFRVHFAQQPRATVSAPRLKRLVAVLAAASDELAANEAQAENARVLKQHVATWRTELDELARSAPLEPGEPRELTNQLGAVANRLFQIYQRDFAGQQRLTRNLQLLSEVCDRLTDIAELMAAHDARTQEPMNRKNLAVVDERLRRYEAEWVEIAKAKADKQAAEGGAPKAPAPLPGISIAAKKG